MRLRNLLFAVALLLGAASCSRFLESLRDGVGAARDVCRTIGTAAPSAEPHDAGADR
jgi:hypothetical protein